MTRSITGVYQDPLDELWLGVARTVGLRVRRTPDAYAGTDGRGTLWIGSPEGLDADDCLAQMILHELCHALVQGPDAFDRPDWGLDNTSERDLDREHAALRLQAALLAPYGLRDVLAPTTDHRAYYDALPDAPLMPGGRSDVVILARTGRNRADRHPFSPTLFDALDRTARVARIVAGALPAGSEALLAAVRKPQPTHPATGFFCSEASSASCHQCAFGVSDRGELRCFKAGVAVRRTDPACERFEPELDCENCGACCREAYGTVELGDRDGVTQTHQELVEEHEGRRRLKRVGERCIALSPSEPFRCQIYPDRPQTCRDFERGGEHCLTARRRVGLSL